LRDDLCALLVDICDDHPGTTISQQRRYFRADTPATPGHDNDPTGETYK
jgi:hypothetical protein